MFAVVCAPNESSVAVAGYFLNELKARGMPCAGVLVNQMHPTLGELLDPALLLEEHARRLASDLDENTVNQFLARLGVNHRRLLGLSQSEQAMTGQLHPLLTSEQTMWQIPRLEGEVHDIEALGQIFDHVKEVHRE
jgi:anion-transporting  ArsA/GET3 family ATPase